MEANEEIKVLRARLGRLDQEIFNKQLYGIVRQVSNSFRQRFLVNSTNAATINYAEVDTESFVSLITGLKDHDIGFTEEACFVDVGCGPAKTLTIIALLNVFKRSIGIEILPDVVYRAKEAVERYNQLFRSPVDVTEIEVVYGDGTFYDWSFAALVYVQATSFNEEMMGRITALGNRMKPGSVLIIINNRFVCDELHSINIVQ